MGEAFAQQKLLPFFQQNYQYIELFSGKTLNNMTSQQAC